MDWEKLLSPYAGKPITVWIEDRSGEEQTKPKQFSIYKVKVTKDQKHLQFYFNPSQFLSVPLFDGEKTRMENSPTGTHFVSHDDKAGLWYWVHFDYGLLK